MRIIHTLPKGQRIMKGKSKVKYNGRRVPVFTDVECLTEDYWWLEGSKKWVSYKEAKESGEDICSSHCEHIHSVKTFKRRLKQWSEYMPKGTKFKLCSVYVGCEVIGII